MRALAGVAIGAGLLAAGGFAWFVKTTVGKQPDGTFLVATARRVEPGTIAFSGRPMELAIHPNGQLFAVATNREVFLCDATKILPGSNLKLAAGVSYRGMAWSATGSDLYLSLSNGTVSHYTFDGASTLKAQAPIPIAKGAPRKDVVAGGLCLTKNGQTLYVVDANSGQVLQIDAATGDIKSRIQVGNIPFECRLSPDEKTLAVSNWGGRDATKKEADDGDTDDSDGVKVPVDAKGTSVAGTVSLINLADGKRNDVAVGVHPSGLAMGDTSVWVANAGSDSVSEIDLAQGRVKQTIQPQWNKKALFGSIPNSLALRGTTLYACNGGDNAICEIDTRRGTVNGFRPAGFFPVAVQVTPDGAKAFVCNTKGNGSVQNSLQGKPAGVHDFQGTVSVLDLSVDLKKATDRVAELNDWNRTADVLNPKLPVYDGRIKHVLYIIKENKTYDSVFGDMPQGDGDPKLCQFPEQITPNAHKLAREFTLFDNSYVSGTNSAEGHQWALEGLANDYIERFYGGYSRSYPYDGGDSMAYSHGGFIWDSVLDAGKTVRNYGEFCTEGAVKITPRSNWLALWNDRKPGGGKITIQTPVSVKRVRPFTHPSYPCWPISVSDQYRADTFIKEYASLSAADKVPNLMVMTLPCDHSEGTSVGYPTPRSMVADNDLAMGRVIEAVSHSPQWKDTVVIVMQDDGQGALDHIDGHRTVFLVASPYTRRGFVDSTLYTQVSVVSTITHMLGTKPLTRMDATTPPLTNCFSASPDLTPFDSTPNRIPLDDLNPARSKTSGMQRYWLDKSQSLDFSGVDTADWYWLNRINWAATKGWDTPYPSEN